MCLKEFHRVHSLGDKIIRGCCTTAHFGAGVYFVKRDYMITGVILCLSFFFCVKYTKPKYTYHMPHLCGENMEIVNIRVISLKKIDIYQSEVHAMTVDFIFHSAEDNKHLKSLESFFFCSWSYVSNRAFNFWLFFCGFITQKLLDGLTQNLVEGSIIGRGITTPIWVWIQHSDMRWGVFHCFPWFLRK